MSTAHGAVHT